MDSGKVKKIQVCIHAGAKDAFCFQAHDLCSAARALMHGRFNGKRPLLADKMLQKRCIGAVDARMEHTGGGIGTVRDHAAICVAQDIADIVLVGNKVNHGHIAMRGLQQIEQRGKGLLPLLLRDGGNALSLILAQIFQRDTGCNDILKTDEKRDIFKVAAGQHASLERFAERRIRQVFRQDFQAALLALRRQNMDKLC